MDEMKQTKNSRLRRIASGMLAALMLMTSAPVSYALEPVIGIQQMAPEQAEETTGEEIPEPEQDPDNGASDPALEENEEVMDEPAPDEEPGGEDEEQGPDGQPALPVEGQPETPPVQDSGEAVVPEEDEPLSEEPTVGSSGLDPPAVEFPEEVSFEASKAMAMSRTARSAPGSTTIYMERIDDISHSYPFSGGSPYYGYLFYTAEGDTAYCVEPARFNSTTGTVVTGSKTYSGLTQTQQNEIARAIAANLGGHTNPYKYMACQAIIWEIAYNQSPRGGSVYNAVIAQNSGKLSSYYEEIRSEMENMGEIPSFMSPDPQNPTEHSMEENGGEWSIDLENTNGNVTLREEDFESRAPFDFSVSGDTLTVTSSSEPDSEPSTATAPRFW